MGLKNYTTKVPASQSVAEIQEMLAKRGVSGVSQEFEEGRISELSFRMLVNGNTVAFRLPLRWRECALAISKDMTVESRYRNRALKDDDYSYRVAWRIMRDWVSAQMALYDLTMVKMEEIFLPYAVMKGGNTLFEAMEKDPTKLLGTGV